MGLIGFRPTILWCMCSSWHGMSRLHNLRYKKSPFLELSLPSLTVLHHNEEPIFCTIANLHHWHRKLVWALCWDNDRVLSTLIFQGDHKIPQLPHSNPPSKIVKWNENRMTHLVFSLATTERPDLNKSSGFISSLVKRTARIMCHIKKTTYLLASSHHSFSLFRKG